MVPELTTKNNVINALSYTCVGLAIKLTLLQAATLTVPEGPTLKFHTRYESFVQPDSFSLKKCPTKTSNISLMATGS